MYLKHLSLLNYKNIADAEIDFSPKINCLIGSNGEGKTNTLDAIYFLSFTKSATNAIDSMNIRHGEDMMMLQGVYDVNGTEETFHCGMKARLKKMFRRGQKAYQKLHEHIGLLPLVIVSPNDSWLISGGSEERRKFIDSVISQFDPSYLPALTRYNRALMQRNALLKLEEPNEDVIATLEEMMAASGEEIFHKRDAFIERFVPVFQRFYEQISQNHEQVGLQYISHCQRGPLLEVIRRDRQKDLIVGYSLHGIHKDDLVMTLEGYNIKREGSQGQSKSFLIALKLSQFEFLKQTGSHTTPILLLDDIFDKLDTNRMEQIIQIVTKEDFGQIFITDTNKDNLSKILARTDGDYSIFEVSHGVISVQTIHHKETEEP